MRTNKEQELKMLSSFTKQVQQLIIKNTKDKKNND